MDRTLPLAHRATVAALAVVARSLRIRGFFHGDDGFSRRVGERVQRVRIESIEWPGSPRAGLEVALELVGPDGEGVVAMLWDLIPARERGGAWSLTPDSDLRAVTGDLVAALERYGVSYLDALAAAAIEDPADRVGPGRLDPVVPRPVEWRDPRARRRARLEVAGPNRAG